MSDTSSRDSEDNGIVADFDQTNGMMERAEGESDGTAAGEARSRGEREDDGGGGAGGVLDDLHDGNTDPNVGDPDRMRSTAVSTDGDDRA